MGDFLSFTFFFQDVAILHLWMVFGSFAILSVHPVETTVAGFKALNYPDVCTNAPFGKGSAFCASHCATAQQRAIPTQLREFLHQYCGVSKRKNGKFLYCHARLCLFLEKAILFRLKGP